MLTARTKNLADPDAERLAKRGFRSLKERWPIGNASIRFNVIWYRASSPMLGFIKRLIFRRKRTSIDGYILRLIKGDKGEELVAAMDAAALNTARVTSESFCQQSERVDSSVLRQEHKTILALAIDYYSPKCLRSLAAAGVGTSEACLRDTFTVNGLVSADEIKKMGFRQHQHLKLNLEEYFDSWVRSKQRLLLSNNPKDRRRKKACQNTIRAIKESFQLELNEFKSQG